MERETSEAAGPAASPPAAVAVPAIAPAAGLAGDLAQLDRLDAPGRARAIAGLQARAGNAWVARRLARKPLASGRYAYDRTTFNEQRFDGEVDPALGTITIVLRVRYVVDGPSFASLGLPETEVARLVNTFKQEFEPAVRAVWEDRWSIRPSMPVDGRYGYKPRVRIVEDASNPHTAITVKFPKASFASNVERHRDLEGGVMQAELTVEDTKQRTIDWVRRRPPGGGPPAEADKVSFTHVTAAHEFGHMIDLRHSNQDHRSGPDEYGGTYEQAADVMGYGTRISRGDYAPWLRIGEAYSAERMPGLRITWAVGDIDW